MPTFPTARMFSEQWGYADANKNRGTFEDPIPQGPVSTFADADGVYFINTEPNSFHEDGEPALFDTVWELNDFPSLPGAKILQSEGLPTKLWNLIPADQTKRTSYRLPPETREAHFLGGGEILPIITNPDFFTPPPNDPDLALKLEPFFDMNCLTYPRFVNLLGLMGDKGSPDTATGDKRDAAWLLRYWQTRLPHTKVPPVGWYYSVIPKWGDGANGWHYDELLWMFLNYTLNPTSQNWAFFLMQALARACYSFNYTSEKKWWHYEKGGSAKPGEAGLVSMCVGESVKPDWAKQWGFGQLVAWMASKKPILYHCVKAYSEFLETDEWLWSGRWGARLAARPLYERRVYSELFEDVDKDKIDYRYQVDLVNALNKADEPLNQLHGTFWWNLGSPNNTSPWMVSQLCNEVGQAHMRGFSAPNLLEKLEEIGDNLWEWGTYEVNGMPHSYYRIGPDGYRRASSNTLIGWFIPFCRTMNAIFGGPWGARETACKSSCYDWIGSNFSDIAEGFVPDMHDVGYDYAPKGIGGVTKTWKGVFESMKT